MVRRAERVRGVVMRGEKGREQVGVVRRVRRMVVMVDFIVGDGCFRSFGRFRLVCLVGFTYDAVNFVDVPERKKGRLGISRKYER